MVKKRLIACLDVAAGRVVKGVRFERLRDVGDPVELAERYSEVGVDELVFLDIAATVEERGPLLELVERAAERLTIPFTVGGGVSGRADARASVARRSRQGRGQPNRVRAARRADARSPTSSAPRPSSARSTRAPAASSRTAVACRGQAAAVGWAVEAAERGAGELLVTSIDADGTRAGYDLELTGGIAAAVEVPVIASGGAGEAQHLADAFAAGAEAALVASIVHERPERVAELKAELREAGWNLRS